MIIKVEDDFVGLSPKNFLKKRLDTSPQKIWKMIDNGKLLINNRTIGKSYKFRTGDEIQVLDENIKLREKFTKKKNFESENLKMDVISENEDFLILNKQANIVVQTGPENTNSLFLHLNYLRDKNNDKIDFNYTNCHRLDKHTSGAIVCAKNPICLRDINKLFKDKLVFKKYLCLTLNSPKEKEGIIEVELERTPEGISPKVIVSKKGSLEKTKRLTKSKYKIIETFKKNGTTFSLIEIQIITGYTHQIRAHMKYLKCPIIFDKMYGNTEKNREYEHILDRQFLHAKSVEFEYKNKNYLVEAPFTKDLEVFLNYLKK